MEANEMYGNFSNSTIDYNGTSDDYDEESTALNMSATIIVLFVIYTLISTIGLIGNTLVIFVVSRYSTMRTVTNTYILNLAVADSCFLISIPFTIATLAMGSWPFGYFMCKAFMILTGINQFTSSIFLCIMGADRYLAICHPKTAHRFRTTLMARIVSTLAWTTSTLMMSPIIMYTTLIPEGDGNVVSCNIVWPSDNIFGMRTFVLYTFVVSFVGPLFLTIVFYSSIINMLKNNGSQLPSAEKTKSRQKVTKLVLAVISVYVVCWLPYWVMQISLAYSSSGFSSHDFIKFLFISVSSLAYSNSAINPILYAFLSDNFCKSFKKACSCFVKNTEGINTTITNNEMGKTETTKLDKTTNGLKSSVDF